MGLRGIIYEEVWELAPEVPNLKAVILFGSAARAEEDRLSDIDLLFLYTYGKKIRGTKIEEKGIDAVGRLRAAVERRLGSRISISALHSREQDLERGFLNEIAADARLLWGEAITLKFGKKDLAQVTVISFGMPKLIQAKKVQLNRALYGRREKGCMMEGAVERAGAVRLGDGAIMVRSRGAGDIKSTLRLFGVAFKEYNLLLFGGLRSRSERPT
jgi:predicted nucleotidyltransferase